MSKLTRRADKTKVFKSFLKDRGTHSLLIYIKIRNIKISKKT